jgi:hypothetical protein
MKVSRLKQPQPWTPGDATDNIREIAASNFALSLTGHVTERMEERDLTTADIRHILRRGFVYEQAQETTRSKCFKYCIDASTPNSGSRTVRLVVVPCTDPLEIKIVTVMWRDEGRK